MVEPVKKVLMRRDQMPEEDVDDLIEEFKKDLEIVIMEGSLEEAYELVQDYFGLEPDYLEEFLF